MALYYGFFDALLDSEGNYDRLYDANDIVEYCAKIIGSGVCTMDSADSFKVTYSDYVATVAPGFLFIQGYWLKNDGNYTINLPGNGEWIVYAQLDTTNRLIKLAYGASDLSPSNALILARVNISTDTATDLRSDSTVCGIIDTAGSLSDRVTSVQAYVANSITGVLNQLRSDVQNEVTTLRTLQDEAQDIIDDIEIPVGEMKFSLAAQSADWLRCDGSFISRTRYPALCALLGGHSLVSRVTSLYSQSIGTYISNGCVANGKFWFYDQSHKKLIAIELSGTNVGDRVEYGLSSLSFGVPTAACPYCLTVSDAENVYMAHRKNGIYNYDYTADLFVGYINSSGSLSGMEATGLPREYTGYAPSSGSCENLSTIVPYVIESGTGFKLVYRHFNNGNETDTVYPASAFCSQLPPDLSSLSSSDFTVSLLTPPYTNNASPAWQFSRWGYNAKNGYHKNAINVRWQITAGHQLRTAAYAVPDTAASINTLTTGDDITTDFSGYTITGQTTLLTVASDSFILFDVRIGSTGFLFYSIDYQTSKPHLVEYPMTVPSTADVFMESAVYAEGSFFVFVGCGMFAFTDPTDVSTYSYVSFTDIMTPITRFGYLGYDSTNQQLVLLGVEQDTGDGNPKTVVYTISLNRWLVSDTGAYLPKVSRNGVPAYVKAV